MYNYCSGPFCQLQALELGLLVLLNKEVIELNFVRLRNTSPSEVGKGKNILRESLLRATGKYLNYGETMGPIFFFFRSTIFILKTDTIGSRAVITLSFCVS